MSRAARIREVLIAFGVAMIAAGIAAALGIVDGGMPGAVGCWVLAVPVLLATQAAERLGAHIDDVSSDPFDR